MSLSSLSWNISYTDPYILSVATVEMRVLTGINNGMNMICDSIIMASLCYYLNFKRTGFRRYASALNYLRPRQTDSDLALPDQNRRYNQSVDDVRCKQRGPYYVRSEQTFQEYR